MMKPKARGLSQLLLRPLDDELIIYDKLHDQVHCLNHSASALWRRCDGQSTITELAEGLGEDLGKRAGQDVVHFGLRQLADAKLMTNKGIDQSLARPTRRSLLRRLAGAAILLPTVTSILAPTPAMAQSGLPNGADCTSSAQCISGCCNTGSQRCVGMGNCLP